MPCFCLAFVAKLPLYVAQGGSLRREGMMHWVLGLLEKTDCTCIWVPCMGVDVQRTVDTLLEVYALFLLGVCT